jgi:adenine-specific DNA-methyltransferase
VSTHLEKLQNLLRELFQLDQADLDFGIYRIMNHNRDEIVRFLENDLLPQVQQGFEEYEVANKELLQNELKEAIDRARELGYDQQEAENTPKAKEIRQKLQAQADLEVLEQEVYAHLYSFFRRYYQEGDFLSLRRYKEGVYAIPYEGEEVKLHWANADQYYIKTSEHFRNYAFKLPSERRVRFEMVAATTERDNNKAANGKERRFILSDGEPVVVEQDELVLRFEYRIDEEKRKQEELNQLTSRKIMALPDLQDWQRELAIKQPTEKNAERTLLDKYLADFTAKNTFDYFIHKDLGRFLRRELDFYIKAEVIRLEDIENESPIRVKHFLSKVKVLRSIANKIITFLAQIEDFQKKLWLKKKFVLETHYCITLDRVPEALYPEIVENEAQIEEWKRLFSIHEVEEKIGDLFGGGTPGYSEPLTLDFLKANSKLLIDTRFFGEAFKTSLLNCIDNFDEQCDGLLIHSENFQALNLLQERYREQIKTSYIDPPYNTSSSSIPYKNNYQHSSWGTLMYDRLKLLREMLTMDGAIFVSIDKTERTLLEHMMDLVFGSENRIEELIWSMNTNNSQAPNYSTNHEYVEVYAKERPTAEQDPNMFREPKPGFEEVMALVAELNSEYPPISKIEAELRNLYQQHKIEYREAIEAQGMDWESEKSNDPWKGMFNYNRAEYRSSDGLLIPEAEAEERKAQIWVWRESDPSMPATKQSSTTRDPDHPNYRFYRPLHPITERPCPHPKSGWKFAYNDDNDSPEKKSFVSLDKDRRIVWGDNEKKVPQLKRMLHEVETNVGKSVFQDYSDGEKQTSAMFGQSGIFLAPKHADFVARFILHAAKQYSTILDCFGGSGSTAHAVIKLNREDHGTRRYILIEVNHYFDTVLKPRVLKSIYSRDWRDGKPVSRNGISHCVKYIRLESYEDTLTNIKKPERTKQQELVLEQNPRFREEYLLSYKLDTETSGSISLLNPSAFIDPFSYQLKVIQNDDTRHVTVDLVETFNYLLGLTVQRIRHVQNIRVVQGINRKDQQALILWRNLEQVDRDALDAWFIEQGFNSDEPSFDLLYVNGDNNLENLRPANQTWRVLLIDAEFQRLMFDTQEV